MTFMSKCGAGIPVRQSRQAAQECSPRRKPWFSSKKRFSPEGAKEKTFAQGSGYPQGLKPSSLAAFIGTTEVIPFPKPFYLIASSDIRRQESAR
jgi:hypothetical protein